MTNERKKQLFHGMPCSQAKHIKKVISKVIIIACVVTYLSPKSLKGLQNNNGENTYLSKNPEFKQSLKKVLGTVMHTSQPFFKIIYGKNRRKAA